MATLHILSHSPFGDSRFASCLRVLGADDAILLTGDAVHALQPETAPAKALNELQQPLFVLEEDQQARGIPGQYGVTALDYSGFVDLTVRYAKVNSWL